MKALSTYKSQIITATIMLVLCGIIYVVFLREQPIPTSPEKNTAEIQTLRSELEASKASKTADFEAYQDSMESYRSMINNPDTNTFSNIKNRYHEQAKNRSRITSDSSALLMRDRLRKDSTYSKRFDYSLLN